MVRKLIGSVLIIVGLLGILPGIGMLLKGGSADISAGGSRWEDLQADSARRNARIETTGGLFSIVVFSVPFIAGVWLVRRASHAKSRDSGGSTTPSPDVGNPADQRTEPQHQTDQQK